MPPKMVCYYYYFNMKCMFKCFIYEAMHANYLLMPLDTIAMFSQGNVLCHFIGKSFLCVYNYIYIIVHNALNWPFVLHIWGSDRPISFVFTSH